MHKFYLPMIKVPKLFTETFPVLLFSRNYNRKIDTVAKRASMLEEMLKDKDKKKNWIHRFVNNTPKARNLIENVHRPNKRRKMLNSLFIQNITDVISTGGASPDILDYGIEITGLNISPCYQILNVFWQIPENQNENAEKIGMVLNREAPRIRAELISRNVMGRVPVIYFLRDVTNAKIAAFEDALKKLEVEKNPEPCIIPDDIFVKNIYSFSDSKASKKEIKVASQKEVKAKENNKISLTTPHKPVNMKSDVFGLDHAAMMEKVNAIKKRPKQLPKESAVISAENVGDLFSKIPGVCFQEDSNREEILKKFQSVRKGLIKKKSEVPEHDYYYATHYDNADDYEPDQNVQHDFIEEQ